MLMSCPECNHEVSDRAVSCPRCGYPIAPERAPAQTKERRKRKRMRLPNGFGQISEIKNQNLRKPYRAMITVGKNEYGRPICKLLQPVAYFETYNEAYAALLEYNKNPVTAMKTMTVEEVYEAWSKEAYEEVPKSAHNYKNAWNYVKQLKHKRFSDIRVVHIKSTMEDASPATSRLIKMLWGRLFKYALEYEIVDRNYAELCSMPKDKKYKQTSTAHKSYTDDEMKKLEESTMTFAKLIVFQCYSGLRPSEICELLVENIHIEERYLVCGVKTEAGKNRVVPLHPKTIPILADLLSGGTGQKYLIAANNHKMSYTQFHSRYKKCLDELEVDSTHTPHDGRKHFITMANRYGLNEYAIKRIVGHSIRDITEFVYTERDIDWLIAEMSKIPM